MRSRNEQQFPIENTEPRELQLLNEVEETPDVSQRDLSGRMGIALGLTNVLLRNLIQKGYVRVAQASWKRRLYTITPEGFAHRVRLMTTYIRRVLNHYKTVRQALREQLEPLALNAESRVAIYGTDEFAELVFLGLKEIGIEETDFYGPPELTGGRFLGMPIYDSTKLQPENYDRIVVASLQDEEAIIQGLEQLGATSSTLVTFFVDGKA